MFWAVTNSFHKEIVEVKKEINEVEKRLSKEINEIKVEQAKIESRIEGRLGLLEGRLTSLEKTVRYILDCFPKSKISIQPPEA